MMTRKEAEDFLKLCEKTLKENNLSHWKILFDNRKRAFGSCSYSERAIYFSKYFIKNASYEEMVDTLYHEVAHALTPGHGHGTAWKVMCEKLGAKPERCGETTMKRDYKYILECSCKKENPSGFYREPSRQFRCRVCREIMDLVQIR